MLTGSSTPRQPKRAIIYVRVSRYRDKDEKISPELQIEACTTLAEREGMVIVDVLQDLNLSGKYFAKRQIEQIIQRVAEARRVVLVWRWSRFGRDATLSSYNIKRVERAGGEIRAAKEDIDTSSSGGRPGRNTHLVVAEYEVDRSRESWMETHDHRCRRGVTHDGQLWLRKVQAAGRRRSGQPVREVPRGGPSRRRDGGRLRPGDVRASGQRRANVGVDAMEQGRQLSPPPATPLYRWVQPHSCGNR